MARILAGKTGPWFIPSKMLERDLIAEEYERFGPAPRFLMQESLRSAYQQIASVGGSDARRVGRALMGSTRTIIYALNCCAGEE